jgi:2-oxoglutarate ferredoxin oxidoreductase subunit beta
MSEKALFTRPESFTDHATHYCPGCGHGIIHKLIAEVVDDLGIKEDVIGIAPVGCSVIAYDYFTFDMSETAHGRAPAVATGLKRALPDKLVFAYQGDGDLASIGMAEIIHAANRGENYTTIFVNNTVYGMTGGQMAPTTMIGQKTITTPQGRDPKETGNPLRMCEMISILDSPVFIQRTSVHNPGAVVRTKQALQKAFEYQREGRGFTFVEILSSCPTYWRMEAKEAMDHIKDTVSTVYPIKTFRDIGAE